jgi:hypothetical protein
MNEGSSEILALADALRTPLLRLHLNASGTNDPKMLQVITEHALRDIDAFMATYSTYKDSQISMQTISLGSVMNDAVMRLNPYAKIAGVSLAVDDRTKHQPVLGNASLLLSGLELATKSMCDFASDAPTPTVTLQADTRHGYPRLGVYRSDVELTAADINLARKLIGGAAVNAGVFQQLGALRIQIASRLLAQIGLSLRSAKSAGRHGIALQLLPSAQMGLFEGFGA